MHEGNHGEEKRKDGGYLSGLSLLALFPRELYFFDLNRKNGHESETSMSLIMFNR